MSGLKDVFGKLLGRGTSEGGAPGEEDQEGFDWSPDSEVVAPTVPQPKPTTGSVRQGADWRRTADAQWASVPGETTVTDAPKLEAEGFGRVGESLPHPSFGPDAEGQQPKRDSWQDGFSVLPTSERRTATPSAPVPPPVPSATSAPPFTASTSTSLEAVAPVASKPTVTSGPALLLSDFEDVYRKAGIKSPVHGYGVERVYGLITSRRLQGLDRVVRRSALLTALDAASVPPSDVMQDAVLRRKALAAHEAEKALELQSLRSRNEQRMEALQDSIHVMTRQKQASVDGLAQASAAVVRTQSDLEIRKRMEQERLYRVLAYFVEPLPPPIPIVPPQVSIPAASGEATSPTATEAQRQRAIPGSLSRPSEPRIQDIEPAVEAKVTETKTVEAPERQSSFGLSGTSISALDEAEAARATVPPTKDLADRALALNDAGVQASDTLAPSKTLGAEVQNQLASMKTDTLAPSQTLGADVQDQLARTSVDTQPPSKKLGGDARGELADAGAQTLAPRSAPGAATPARDTVDFEQTLAPGLAEALRAAAREAQQKGWGRPQIVEDQGDAAETLRALRGDASKEPSSGGAKE